MPTPPFGVRHSPLFLSGKPNGPFYMYDLIVLVELDAAFGKRNKHNACGLDCVLNQDLRGPDKSSRSQLLRRLNLAWSNRVHATNKKHVLVEPSLKRVGLIAQFR